MEEKLQKLGLTYKEAKIYLALLEIGSGTITQIAKKSGVIRTSVYDHIETLLREGLIAKLEGFKKDTYRAEAPEKLPLILEKRVRDINDKITLAQCMISELRLVASKQPGKPKVSLFEGVEGIRELYDNTLLSGETIRSFSSTESLESFDPEFLHNYYKRRADKGIFIKAILNDIPGAHEYKAEDKGLNREIRIVPKEMMNIGPEVYVYENKVAFFSLKEQFGVLVESYDIATALKKIYDLAWLKAGELDKKG